MTLRSCQIRTLVIVFMVMGYIFVSQGVFAEKQNHDILPILEAAESLFKAMKEKNYPRIWSHLTQKTRQIILDDVRKALEKTDATISMNSLQTDFSSGGRYAREYWEAYLGVFDPDTVLELSKWEAGKVGENEGEIILRYKKSDQPAILKVFKENNSWKVGMEETFRPRRWLK
jgi:hypothetical protein